MENKEDWIAQYKSKTTEVDVFLNDLRNIIIQSNGVLEGNSFYYHGTIVRHPELLSKQVNLFWVGTQIHTRICEIGFNAGHSSMLMLLGKNSDTPIDFTVFDIGNHPYMKPCLKYIQNQFSDANFEFIEGDSTIEMPKWIETHPELLEQYDVVHIDGGHNEHCIKNDFANSLKLVKINGIIIIDDTNDVIINLYVDYYLEQGNYKEVDILPSYGYPHRIIQRIK